jgi:hypothetical protein
MTAKCQRSSCSFASGHQTQQFLFVGPEKPRIHPGDFLRRVCGTHSNQGIFRPQAGNQLWEQL